jgi:hypothetical protein
METQLRSGGWPVYSDETDPCLLTTCYAVHALALARPLGWERKVRAASDWLWSQQNPFGYWIIEGGPTVMLTVLVLDAIALAKGLPTTFGADTDPTSISGNDNLHEQIQASVCVLEGAENQGTGFFIKEFGLITCNHVYREDLKVFTYTKPEEKSPVTRVVCDKNIDLAVLKTQFKPKHYLEADFREPKDGEHVLLCGFPKYAPGSTVVKAEAQITGSRMYFGNRRYLLDKPIVVGNSGGPVIDMRGKVIGVAATGTNDRSDGNPDEQFGVIPVVLLRQLLALNERK